VRNAADTFEIAHDEIGRLGRERHRHGGDLREILADLNWGIEERPLARGLQEGEIRQQLQSGGHLRNVLIITKTIEGAADHLAYVRPSWRREFLPLRTWATRKIELTGIWIGYSCFSAMISATGASSDSTWMATSIWRAIVRFRKPKRPASRRSAGISIAKHQDCRFTSNGGIRSGDFWHGHIGQVTLGHRVRDVLRTIASAEPVTVFAGQTCAIFPPKIATMQLRSGRRAQCPVLHCARARR
jgi:hypothetical protein